MAGVSTKVVKVKTLFIIIYYVSFLFIFYLFGSQSAFACFSLVLVVNKCFGQVLFLLASD